MSLTTPRHEPPDPDDGPRLCGRCGHRAPDGQEVRPRGRFGAALGLNNPVWVCRDCVARLERILAGWNR